MKELVEVSIRNFKTLKVVVGSKERLNSEERNMLSNAYKNYVAKKRATLRKLQVLQKEQNLKDD